MIAQEEQQILGFQKNEEKKRDWFLLLLSFKSCVMSAANRWLELPFALGCGLWALLTRGHLPLYYPQLLSE